MRKFRIVPGSTLCSVVPVGEASQNHFRRVVSDPEALEDALRGASIDARLLAPARGVSELQRMLLPRVCLDSVRLSSTLLVSGEMAADCHTLIYVSECPSDGHSFNFGRKHGAGYMGFFAPGGVVDAMTPAGYANATLTIPVALFDQERPSRCPDFPEPWLREGGALCVSEGARRRFARLLAGKQELDRCQPDWHTDRAALAGFEEDLLAVFLEGLGDDPRWPDGHLTAARVARRYGAMRKIREYVSDNKRRPLRLAELCEVSGMSRRGLEYLFKDFFGIGANAFIRFHRLHGARRSLLATEPSPGLIKRTALEWGFWHLGRFALEYRGLFGELPHETRLRRAPGR